MEVFYLEIPILLIWIMLGTHQLAHYQLISGILLQVLLIIQMDNIHIMFI